MKAVRKAIGKAMEDMSLLNPSKAKDRRALQQAIEFEEGDSEEDESAAADGECRYLWSGVLSISYGDVMEGKAEEVQIDKGYFQQVPSKGRGRPMHSWEFLFSPQLLDQDISLD